MHLGAVWKTSSSSRWRETRPPAGSLCLANIDAQKASFFFFFFLKQITAIEKYGDAVDLYICIIHYAIVRLIFHRRFIFNAAKL